MKRELFASLFLACACVVGCDDKKTDTVAPVPTDGAKTTMDKASDKTDAAMEKTGNVLDKAAAKTVDAADKAGAAMTTDSAEAQTKAASLMQEVQKYIAEKKWSDADSAIAKLEDLKPKLPATLGTQIDALKDSVAKMKAMGGSMPAVPAMPK